MPLASNIQSLRDRTLSELAQAHDYFVDSKFAWRNVEVAVTGGLTFVNTNSVTGTVTTDAELVLRARGYVTEQLAQMTFLQFISIFENFLFEFLRLWLTAYPQSLARKMVDVRTILDSPDKDAILAAVVGREVNDVLYDRPAGWFAYIDDRVKLGCPTADEIEQISEAKASRDVQGRQACPLSRRGADRHSRALSP